MMFGFKEKYVSKFSYGRFKEDIEKAVLPTILYMSKTVDGLTAYGFAVGWWDWGIRLFIYPKQLLK